MTGGKYISSIKFEIIFPESPDLKDVQTDVEMYFTLKNKIYSLFNEFGFNNIFQYNDTSDCFKAKSSDFIFESLKQRTKFVIKRASEENNIKILGYKIKSIILDSLNDDSLFPSKVNL